MDETLLAIISQRPSPSAGSTPTAIATDTFPRHVSLLQPAYLNGHCSGDGFVEVGEGGCPSTTENWPELESHESRHRRSLITDGAARTPLCFQP